MKIKFPHIPYVSRKIGIDMYNSGFIKFNQGIESVVKIAEEVITNDAIKEKALDEKTENILEENSEDMHIMQVDRRSMFWMVKKRLAEESDFILKHDDRYNKLSHEILELSWKKNYIDYSVSENRARNIIYSSIEEYLKNFEKIEDIVVEKLENSSKKLIPGTPEYDLAFEKYYQDELKKRGMF
ncbi:DUF507 family protein [Campylobacter ureolyticus]|uniref:DUF507 family protein n=1 Tax=Campylobacter ureolyticus TaxID=827 RepID=UPI0022B3AB7E|nr:DUF507 family protein [Campylobacter ureolyticus]MCZ6103767.1 DUF507 family protein [Campylobacter ureolyticus]